MRKHILLLALTACGVEDVETSTESNELYGLGTSSAPWAYGSGNIVGHGWTGALVGDD